MNMLDANLQGYGSSSSELEEDEQTQHEESSSEDEQQEQVQVKKRKFVPRAQKYMDLLNQNSDEDEDLDSVRKRRHIGGGETILDNLPSPEHDMFDYQKQAPAFRQEEFEEFESRQDKNLEPIPFKVEAAANESDVEEIEGAISLQQIQSGQLEGITYDDNAIWEEDELQRNQKQQQQQQQQQEQYVDQYEDLPDDVRERLSKVGGAVQMTEVKAADMRDHNPGSSTNEHDPIVALGTEYALKQRQLAGDAPSRQARRKHQIGSLLYDARMNEMEFILRESQGKKSKAETEAKYGWR
eukprot:TRINITY_DN638_c1_g1_i1.p1 TRINITY_DN638_c1_g1~~TRINITY_DN638_c1_g1_i1.p1  ORF type:complete len:297 (-),score=76.57 TRINITY_DN638_c1_g1_i1:606-1496(-)